MLSCISASALTIESGDFGYIPGHTYNYMAGSYSATGLDLTAGTGKQWNLSTFSGSGHYKFTRVYAVSNVSKFPSATMAIDFDGKTLSSFSGTMYLRELDGDWQNFGEGSSSYTTTYNPYIPLGLPHTVGKSWSASYTLSGATQTQVGTVIAEGKVTTKLGTHDALLVKLQAGSITTYFIETKEYGRIAYVMATNNYLYVMESGTKNVGVKFLPYAMGSEISGQARIYSANGRLTGAADLNANKALRMSAASGAYFATFVSSRYALSQSVTVRK